MKLCLTVLMGLPGSGKTTFAHTLKNNFKYYDNKRYNFIHVCYDDLIPQINFDKSEAKWKDLRTDILNQVEALLFSLKTNKFDQCSKYMRDQIECVTPESVVVIIIDDNMHLKSMRYAVFRKAKEHRISFCQVYLQCPIETAVERNISRTNKNFVPINVITEMSKKTEEPRSDNKWEKHSLVTESTHNELYTNYFVMLNQALENPEHGENDGDDAFDKEMSVKLCMTNVLHQSDIALRQIISMKIQKFICENKTNSHATLGKYSSELRSKKCMILNDIRSGAIHLPENVLDEIQSNVVEKNNLKLFIENILNS